MAFLRPSARARAAEICDRSAFARASNVCCWRPEPARLPRRPCVDASRSLGVRGPRSHARRIEEPAWENVKTVDFEMIEDVLEIIDVPLCRELQAVDGFQENPLRIRCHRRD